MNDLIKKAEAILFAVGRAISEKEMSELSHVSVSEIHHALVELKKEYSSRESPLLVIEEGDSWKLTVHEKFLPIVQGINPHTELSKSILETLAVIAWKQPSTQSDVIKIRTNKAYEHIGELERLGFVSKEKHGRTFYLKVTGKFFDYFDLPKDKGVKEIFKDIKEVEEVVQTKLNEDGVGLETYGVKDEIKFEKEKKPHVGGLEVFEDVETEEKPLRFEEDSSEDKSEEPVKSFIKENKKLAPQEEEMETPENKEENAEETSEEKPEEERELNPELEQMISKKKK